MKKNLLLFSFISGIIIFSSCNNEDNFVIKDDPQTTKAQTFTNNHFYVENGILHFNSAEDASAIADSIVNMSDEDFCTWEKSIGFSSYRSHINNLINELYSIENEQEFNEFIFANSQFLYKFNEDVLPKLSIRYYTGIVNKDGVYYIGNTKYVVDSEYITGYVNEKEQCKISYLGNTSTRAVGNLVYEERRAYFKDRSVFTSARVYKIVISPNTTNTRYKTGVQIYMNGKKKGAFGRWKQYKTVFCVRELLITIDETPIKQTNGIVSEWGLAKYEDNLERNSGKEVDVWYHNIAIGEESSTEFSLQPIKYMEYKAFTRGTGYNNYLLYKVIDGAVAN